MDLRAALDLAVSATPVNAWWLRRQVSAWLHRGSQRSDRFDDLVLATNEAVANVVDHAYVDRSDGPGLVRLMARDLPEAIRVVVADDGNWRESVAGPFRGHGLKMVCALVDDVRISRNGRGTVVEMCLPVSRLHSWMPGGT